MKARFRYDRLKRCEVHPNYIGKKQPTSQCVVCWMMWLREKLEISIFESDMDDLIKFANKFPKKIDPKKIERIEESDEDLQSQE